MPSTRQPPTPDARFVVLEGLDGAGTTTQAGLLAEALRGRGLRVRTTAEPTGGPLGRILRAHVRGELTLDPRTAALAFTADRSDHVARVIAPALASGEWVVCDRYLLSTLAYQGAEGVDREWILAASTGLEVPDLTVFLDVPEEELVRRLEVRSRADRYEGREWARGLRASYAESIDLLRAAGHRVDIVDGCAPTGDITPDVLARLDALGPNRVYP